MMAEPIVVTGIGLVTPLGTGAEAVRDAWLRGESGIRTLSPEDSRLARGIDPNPLPEVGRAGFVRDFRPRELIQQGLLRRMDWCSRMLVAAARQALAGTGEPALDEAARHRSAIVVGSQFGNQRETVRYTRRVLDEGLGAGSPLLFPNLVLNAPAGYAAIELGWTGPNLTVSNHEASGEAALAAAAELIASGACDRAIAGGVDEFGEIYLAALAQRRLLHPASYGFRPPSRRGWIVPGEGAAALLLERRGHAEERGARIYAVLEHASTVGTAVDAHELPSPSAAALALRESLGAGDPIDAWIALSDGGPRRDAIDRACLEALEAASGTRLRCASFRAQTGDWGSAGAVGAALAAIALGCGELPGPPAGEPPRRIALLGVGRGGALAPVCLSRPSGA